ncbi:MAG: hypothetical protein RI948_586 [Bacteroidota bacterium]|jgi:hypothetical protein
MKKLLFFLFFICSTNLFAQYIDNIVLNNSTPPSLHIYGAYGSTGISITSITHEVSDTFKIKLFFKDCPGLTVIVPFDTILVFDNNWPAAPTQLQALSIIDTNTTDLNCGPVTAFDTLYTYNATWQSLNVGNHLVKPKFKVYPNPTSDFITIENNDSEPFLSIELLDYAGKRIKSFDPSNTSVNLSDIAPGVYLLQMTTAQGKLCEEICLE